MSVNATETSNRAIAERICDHWNDDWEPAPYVKMGAGVILPYLRALTESEIMDAIAITLSKGHLREDARVPYLRGVLLGKLIDIAAEARR